MSLLCLKKRKRKRRYPLTDAGRAALRAAAHRNRPWSFSTGPCTPAGKATVSQNALKHGLFSRSSDATPRAAFVAQLRAMRDLR